MSMYGLLDRYENIDDLSKNTEVGHYQLNPHTRCFINRLMAIFDF